MPAFTHSGGINFDSLLILSPFLPPSLPPSLPPLLGRPSLLEGL